MAGKPIDADHKQAARPIVHYAFGTLNGALYGTLSRSVPRVRTGHGALFGAALWAGADEVAVPALRYSKPPSRYPLSTHLYALASHLVYGVASDSAVAALRRAP